MPQWPKQLLDVLTSQGYQPTVRNGHVVMRHWRGTLVVSFRKVNAVGPKRFHLEMSCRYGRWRRMPFVSLEDALHYFAPTGFDAEATP